MNLIRAANEQDAERIAHVHVESWKTTYAGIVADAYLATLDEGRRAKSWRESLAREVPVFVAELDGVVVGFVCGGPIREPVGEFDAELYAIYLVKEAQRARRGTGLLETLANSLMARGFRSMAVWALEENPAGRFYENSGAVRVAAKKIEIGGVELAEVAYGWPRLESIVDPRPPQIVPGRGEAAEDGCDYGGDRANA